MRIRVPCRCLPLALILGAVILVAGTLWILAATHQGQTAPTPGAAVLVAGEPAPHAGEQKTDFQPPTREELARVRWVRQPCVDFLDHLRRTLEKEPRLATEAEALSLENTGEAPNRKILSGLARLPSSDDEVNWDATFNRYTGGEPRTLNPVFASSRYEFWVEDLLHVSPIQFDWDLELYGDLNVIESWETSEDHLMDRIVLRTDLTWEDGKPITAHDVEFSWKVYMSPSIRVVARRTVVEGLKGVKAYDDRTIVYFQKEAFATNRLHLVWPCLPRHLLEPSLREDPTMEQSRAHVDFNKAPMAAGPYRLVRWNRGQEILLERRDAWFQDAQGRQIRKKPFFKQVRFRVITENAQRLNALKAGEVDDALLDSSQWVDETSGAGFYDRLAKVRGDNDWAYAFIGWSAKSKPPNPFFEDKRVRLAMGHALDHRYVLEDFLHGVYRPGQGVFHPDSWMAARELKPLQRDLDLAEKLLDEAGWRDTDRDGVRDKEVDGKKVPFRFTISYPAVGTGPKVAEILQMNLKEIGVQCERRPMEWVEFNKALNDKKLQAFLMIMGPGVDPDMARNLWTTSAYESGRNDVGYSNPRVDELFEKGRREFDRAKRAPIYQEVDRLIYADHPITVLLYQPTLWGFSKSLRGYRPSPKGFYGYAPGFYSIWKKKSS